MIKWKIFIKLNFFIFYYSIINIDCIIDFENYELSNILQDNIYTLEPGKVQIKNIGYENNNPFIFPNMNYTKDLLLHIFSINCDIQINTNNNNIIINNYTNDTFSIRIKSNLINNSKIIVKPLINLREGNYKYKENRICPLVINSIYVNEFKLTIEEKEPTIFFFDKNINNIQLVYDIKNLKDNNFATFCFSYDEKTIFEINFLDDKTLLLNKTIFNTTKILLDYNILSKIKNNNKKLTVSIKLITDENPTLLSLKIIENNSVSILQKNYLNQGFITSNNNYQYYYMEVFKGEEGEIILHNKRQNGKLLGIIKPKESIKNPKNISEYLTEKSNSYLEFNGNTQKLSFTSNQTSQCQKGCYILITYYHISLSSYKPIFGIEFTLLVRIWDEEDYFNIPIINIPFNEYIFGCFEEDSINIHYYSIFIANNTKEIILQIEGNYFEGFIGEGKRKLNIFKKNTQKLDVKNNRFVKIFTKDELKFFKNYISLAFRSKDYFKKNFSFYYFRVIQIKDNENLIYPLDSNVENICLPQKEGDSYYCYFLLRNDYNEFSLNFSVSYPNQNENYNISYIKAYNKSITKAHCENFFIDNDYDNNSSYILFKFQFTDNETKSIVSTFYDKNNNIHPHIYSFQMYYLNKDSLKANFNLKNTFFSLVLKWVHGKGIIDLENNILPKISANSNFKGIPFSVPFSGIKNINITSKNEFIFLIKLDYSEDDRIREIFLNEPIREIFINQPLPIYYYIKYNYQDLDINFRMKNNDDENIATNFEIKGYLINEINDEYFNFNNAIEGNYDQSSKNGILKINKKNINDNNFRNKTKDKYILIEITTMKYIRNSNISIELIAISYNNDILVPINHYINGYTSFLKNISYLIRKDSINNNTNEILIEFSSNYQDIKLELRNENNKNLSYSFENEKNGILKYRVQSVDENIILNIKNPNNYPNGKYILRYYYTNKSIETMFKFSSSLLEKKIYDNNTLMLCFNNLKMYHRNNTLKNQSKIEFIIYGNLFDNKIENEILNTTSIISSKPSYKAYTKVKYLEDNKFYLYFNNISYPNNEYYLQIKINILYNDYLFNEEILAYSIDIKNDDNKSKNFTPEQIKEIEIVLICLAIIIIIVILFSIFYVKMKRKNKSLEEKILDFSMEERNSVNKDFKNKPEKTIFI